MGDPNARLRRRGRDDDLTSTAVRRLRLAAPSRASGWVPLAPGSSGPVAAGAPGAPGEPVPAPAPGRVSARRRPARFAPTGRAVGGLVLLVALAVLTALVSLWLARPREQPVPAAPTELHGAPLRNGSGSSGTAAGPVATASPAPAVLAHVVGAVRRPGVVELPSGSRVSDAVEAAGGVTQRGAAASVNLARPVVDGEQIVVLRRGGPAAAAAPGATGATDVGSGSSLAGAAATGPVDLNAASLDQLDALPGIGPVLAQRILDWRTAHGRFSTVEELGEVSGIGEATLADLRPVVRV